MVKRLLVVDEKGNFQYEMPPTHEVGMEIPDGGSSCENCEHVQHDDSCTNRYFVAWLSGDRNAQAVQIPADASSYCCDFYEAGDFDDIDGGDGVEG